MPLSTCLKFTIKPTSKNDQTRPLSALQNLLSNLHDPLLTFLLCRASLSFAMPTFIFVGLLTTLWRPFQRCRCPFQLVLSSLLIPQAIMIKRSPFQLCRPPFYFALLPFNIARPFSALRGQLSTLWGPLSTLWDPFQLFESLSTLWGLLITLWGPFQLGEAPFQL